MIKGEIAAAVCSDTIIHPRDVKTVQDSLHASEELLETGAHCEILEDPMCLKIFHALYRGELCVWDLSVVPGKTVQAVSHQLAVRRHANLALFRCGGKVAFYILHCDHVRRTLHSLGVHPAD